MTFTFSQDARVTLDGRPAEFRDLKSGQWARVHIRTGAGTGTAKGGATDKDKGTTDKDKVGTGAGGHMMADRIEVSSRGPLPPHTGTGTGTDKDKGSGTKKDGR